MQIISKHGIEIENKKPGGVPHSKHCAKPEQSHLLVIPDMRFNKFCSLYVLLTCLLLFGSLSAQTPFCDVHTDSSFFAQFDQLMAGKPTRSKKRSAPVIEVPLVFHVELQNGNPVISEATINSKLAVVNTYFVSADIRLVNCEPVIYYTETSGPNIKNSVNVNFYASSSGCGVAIGSYIAINVNCNRTMEHILAHEVGHVLGLPHTHGPTNTGTTTELVDGSNCTTNGDRFCDTPADPNLLGLVNGSCMYTGSGTDANGDMYQPDVTNIMSYGRSSCIDKFSQEQLDYMYDVAVALGYACCRVDPPEVSDTSICSGESVTIVATTDIVTATIKWYDQKTGGTPIATGPELTTGPLYNSRSYYVETEDSCTSDRIRVLVTIRPDGGLQLIDAGIFADLDTSSQGSGPYNLTILGDTALIFNTSNNYIYFTNTEMDTVELLADTFGNDPDTYLSDFEVLGDQVIIALNNFNTGPSLWSLDLHNGSVQTLHQFGSGYGYSNYWLTRVDDIVFAQLNNESSDPNGVAELWKTNGTAAGTELVKDLAPSFPFGNFGFTPFNGQLIFVASTLDYGEELWISDGTSANTMMVKDLNPGPDGSQIGSMIESEGLLYFSAFDSTYGSELWVSDGTPGRTEILADINPGMGGSSIYSLVSLNGSLYFTADDGTHGSEPFKSDGTPEGTQLLEDIRGDGGSSPSYFTLYNGGVYFLAYGPGFDGELYRENLSQPGTVERVKDINPTGSSGLSELHIHDELLFFRATNGTHGSELWQSDGTGPGTQLVIDINPGNASASPGSLTTLGDRLFFTANDGTGTELWSLNIPQYATCYDESLTIVSGSSVQDIRWYDASEEGNLLHQGASFTLENITQNQMIYGELSDGTCTSIRYPVPVTISPECPCIDISPLTIDETFGSDDNFILHGSGDLITPSLFLPGADMSFKAATTVSLTAGFEVQSGAQFQVQIAPCQE